MLTSCEVSHQKENNGEKSKVAEVVNQTHIDGYTTFLGKINQTIFSLLSFLVLIFGCVLLRDHDIANFCE